MLSRTASGLTGETNPLYRLRAELARRGRAIVDLISGNVTEHGIRFPQPLLEEIIVQAARRSEVYRTDPLWRQSARAAIAAYYEAQGVPVDPERIVLTPGTSVAYWYCFKLLADEGEEILCPRPTYPLFDYIARLSGVRLTHYPLDESRDWAIDLERLENSISNATRALVLISPHNPTGRVAAHGEIERLADIARRHGLAIIADEVFSEFMLAQGSLPRPAASDAPLVITLNGFSKMFALPGIKLGWIALSGRDGPLDRALRALELISDTFLPVSEITQAAAAEIFREGAAFLQWYRAEIAARWQRAEEFFRRLPFCRFVRPRGGFYVTLRLEGIDEEEVCEELLREAGLLLHPGYFYDMKPHHVVLSFIQREETMRECLPRLERTLAALAARPRIPR